MVAAATLMGSALDWFVDLPNMSLIYLLAVLGSARHAGRVVTHKALLTSVWGPAHGEDVQYLRVLIGHLRTKIERNPLEPQIIRTEPGVGYRFSGGG